MSASGGNKQLMRWTYSVVHTKREADSHAQVLVSAQLEEYSGVGVLIPSCKHSYFWTRVSKCQVLAEDSYQGCERGPRTYHSLVARRYIEIGTQPSCCVGVFRCVKQYF